MSTPQFLLSELATSLMREVFQAITDSADEQNSTFADLAVQGATPFADYEAGLLGGTEQERRLTAESYVGSVVFPLLSLSAPLPPASLPGQIVLAAEGRRLLVNHFRGVTAVLVTGGAATAIEQSLRPTADGRWSLDLEPLLAFVLAKLGQDARLSYQKINALLGAGLSRVTVTGGELLSKVTLHVETAPSPASAPPASTGRTRFPGVEVVAGGDSPLRGLTVQPLRLQARLANESSPAVTQSADLVASVKIEFRIEPFPSIRPA